MQMFVNIFFIAVCFLQTFRAAITATPECSLKCNRGICKVIPGQGPQCVCPPEYTGPSCENHRCSQFCKNKGMCFIEPLSSNTSSFITQGTLQCNCSTTCKNSTNVCDGKCYNNGTCLIQKSGETQCGCKRGFTGDQCQDCTNLVCENGGICIKSETQNICQCDVGYHGKNCEKSDCEHFCLNGGTCILNPTGPTNTKQPNCACPPLFSGQRCQVNVCLEPNAPTEKCNTMHTCGCLNNGTCEKQFDSVFCKCTDLWGGDKCQHYLGHNNPCINWCHNGVCTMKNARALPSCICSDGWTGEQCDQALDCQFYCHNGGTCSIRNGAPYCQCVSNYEGTHCHKLSDKYVASSAHSSSVVLSALLAFGICLIIILVFGVIYYVLRRRHTFFHVRLLENDFNNPMFQERDID